MNLTSKQLRRAAREARKLALECADGLAPCLGVEDYGCAGAPICAVGHVMDRAGWPRGFMTGDFIEACPDSADAVNEVTAANDYAPSIERHEAVVFPLLALADALEAEAERAP